jgi:hypothetical protein
MFLALHDNLTASFEAFGYKPSYVLASRKFFVDLVKTFADERRVVNTPKAIEGFEPNTYEAVLFMNYPIVWSPKKSPLDGYEIHHVTRISV